MSTLPKLIILEDSKSTQSVLRTLLSSEYEIYQCYNIKQAKEAFVKNDISILLLDINLDGESGISFCEYVRETNNNSTPIVFMTVETSEAVVEKCLLAGANDLIHKPFSKKLIQMRLKNQLRIVDNHNERLDIEKEEAVKNIIANICHEVLNPLTKIKGLIMNPKSQVNDDYKIKIDDELSKIEKVLKEAKLKSKVYFSKDYFKVS